ncbi:MAG: endonuclease/exonuclease/phosphatase family protein [Candidatus Levyibacteriota bacterium]
MTLKILQLNIWNGGKLWGNLEAFLKDNSFDILFFQEVFNGHGQVPNRYKTLELFKDMFPGYYSHFAPSFGDIGEYGAIDRGNAIFSKFPITSSDIIFFDLPYRVFEEQKQRDFEQTPRALEYCEVDLGKTRVNLFNHHGIWGHHGDDTPRRLEMGKTIVRHIRNKENVILAGDFNLNPDTETVRMVEKELESVFSNTLPSTFNMKRKDDPGYATAKVDMLFVSKNIKVLEKDCPQVDVSDHFPLTAVLEV